MTEKVTWQAMIKYIKYYINDLSLNERQDILQMLVNASIDDSKLQNKGGGTQIKIRDIPRPTIVMVYNYITHKLSAKLTALQHFPDKDEDDEHVAS